MDALPDLAELARHRPDARIVATEGFTLVKVPPPPALAGLVEDIALYREHSGRPIRQVETAALVVPLLIGFRDPFAIALGRAPTSDDGFQSFTSGLSLKPVNIMSAGGCSCLEFTLTPPGARRFFGLPMRDLTERMVPLGDLGDRALDRLRQRLGEERSWLRRLVIAEAFVTARLTGDGRPPSGAQRAYRAILRSGGRIAVETLAREMEWSRKHLAARFHDEIGLAPKAVARIVRFNRAKALAGTGEASGWADVAAACGYADQAHLARDFRELAGATPRAWLEPR